MPLISLDTSCLYVVSYCDIIRYVFRRWEDVSNLTIGGEKIAVTPLDMDIQELIGKGAYGTVHRMTHRDSNTVMAVKVYLNYSPIVILVLLSLQSMRISFYRLSIYYYVGLIQSGCDLCDKYITSVTFLLVYFRLELSVSRVGMFVAGCAFNFV